MNQNTPDTGDPNRAGCGEVRNGWVLCPSKRFSGRYYYFNVLTGDCAWSLNDIDKAKLKKGEQIKRADSYHSYPEPSSPPIDFISPNTSGSAFNLNPGSHNQNVYVPSIPTAPTFSTSTPQNYVHNSYSVPQPMLSNYPTLQPLHSNHSNFSTPQQQLMNYQPIYLQPYQHHIILATAYPMQNVQNDYDKANAVKIQMFDQNTQTVNAPNTQDNPVWVETQRTPGESESPISRPRNKQTVKNTNLFENRNREVIFDEELEDYIPFQKQKVIIQNPMASKYPNDSVQKKLTVSGTKVKAQCKEIQTDSVQILDSNAKLCEKCECVIPKPNRKRTISEDTTERQNCLESQEKKEDLNKPYFVDTVGNLTQSESTKNNAKVSQRVTETAHHEAEGVTEEADKNVSSLAHNDLRLLLFAKRKKSLNFGELTRAGKLNVEANQDVLPVLLAYTFAYVLVMVAVVLCSVELKSRHLLHSTYKLFLLSITVQHFGVTLQSLAYLKYAVNGFGGEQARVAGQFLSGLAEMTFLLLLVLMAKGYTITRGRLKLGFTVKLTVFMCLYCAGYIVLFIYQAKAFDPGEVLYLYESPPGYGLVSLRLLAWGVFAYATFFTVRKFPEKNTFYCPFFICATLWFFAGPLFIITANSYIDKWVRESVVTAVLLFITFSGHIMFLLLTLPVFANKNFPYHVRTTQVGVMQVRRSGDIDNFGHSAYRPSGGAAQTVIIPLTRRTEELIGNIYSQYMAAPADNEMRGKPNGMARSDSMSPKNQLNHQSSSDTNTSEDIKPTVSSDRGNVARDVFTVKTEMDKYNSEHSPKEAELSPKVSELLPKSSERLPNVSELLPKSSERLPKSSEVPNAGSNGGISGDLPILSPLDPESRKLPLLRSRRTLLDPIKLDEVPSWSFAKGPSVVAMISKPKEETKEEAPAASLVSNGVKKAPMVRNGLPSSGEISTIMEGHVQNYANTVSRATIDLFSAGKNAKKT